MKSGTACRECRPWVARHHCRDGLSERRRSPGFAEAIERCLSEGAAVSVITLIEVLGWRGHTAQSRIDAERLLRGLTLADLSLPVVERTIELRSQRAIKLPDAVIAASARVGGLILVSRNIQDFVPERFVPTATAACWTAVLSSRWCCPRVLTRCLLAPPLGLLDRCTASRRLPRQGVTEAALKLQHAGSIRYARGHIAVIDRKGLERRSRECEAVVKKKYDRLLPDQVAMRTNVEAWTDPGLFAGTTFL